jgi:D-erythritol 1-phosphate dehydrogenase
MDPFDLAVIGGGVNGAGIARDAAGRGLKVLLCEKDDLAQGTSSRSGKLVHGGLRYLEHYEFRLVREALVEREVLLRAAPHIVWPLRFVLPHGAGQRPAWLVRLGLFLYDHLGGRALLPPTRALDLRRAPEGAPLRPEYAKGFEYSDCWVDDARLVVLNALDARQRGAEILTRAACVGGRRVGDVWQVDIQDRRTGHVRTVQARCVVNAAGPWVEPVLERLGEAGTGRRVRLVKGSHLVTRKFWRGPQAYLLQNTDRRVIFVNPYEGDELALIGTTDVPVEGPPDEVAVSDAEVEYLLGAVNRYFAHQLKPEHVLDRFAGVRPLYDDKAENPSTVTRDYVFDLEPRHPGGRAPLLTVFGGKITTYRRLAEHALARLKPFLPAIGPAWTATAALPGGDLPAADVEGWLRRFRVRHPWLPPALARHYGRLYGTRAAELLAGAGSLEQLGRHFGGLLYEREARFLLDQEWAETAEDILERRTKHHLHLTPAERRAFAAWLEAQAAPKLAPAEG